MHMMVDPNGEESRTTEKDRGGSGQGAAQPKPSDEHEPQARANKRDTGASCQSTNVSHNSPPIPPSSSLASTSTSISRHRPVFGPQAPPNHPYALVPPIFHCYPRTTNKITTASGELIEVSHKMLPMAEEAVRMKELQMRLSPMLPGAKWAVECVAPERESCLTDRGRRSAKICGRT